MLHPCLLRRSLMAIPSQSSTSKLLEERRNGSHKLLQDGMRSIAGARTPEEVRSVTASLTTDAVGPHAGGDRITVALVPTAQADLRWLQERTKLSKTDLANRAISSYAFIEGHMHAGHDVIVRDNRTGETELVRFL